MTYDQSNLGQKQKITVVNRGRTALPVSVSKRNFVAKPDGSLVYQADAPYAASQWLTMSPTTFTLRPGETRTVETTIKLPVRAEPGDHQVAVVFLVPAGRTSANIQINRGVATPIYITVPGKITNSTTISKLSAPRFAVGGPVTLTATIRNLGTVHRDFRGSTPLTVTVGGKSVAFPDFTVLRGATREVSMTWHPPLMCVCTPKVEIDNDGSRVETSTQVIVFPLQWAGIVVLCVLGALLALWFFRRRRPAGARGAPATEAAGSRHV